MANHNVIYLKMQPSQMWVATILNLATPHKYCIIVARYLSFLKHAQYQTKRNHKLCTEMV